MYSLRFCDKMAMNFVHWSAVKFIPRNWRPPAAAGDPADEFAGSTPSGGVELEGGIGFTIMYLSAYVIESMDYSIARRTAFRLLSMRNYHSAVLARKLEKKGCAVEICQQVVAECKRLGFLKDDEAILREFRRGYGPRAIEFKLRVDGREIREVITRQMQREKIGQMRPKLGDRNRAIRFLQRRGFDLDLVVESFSYRGVE